MRVTRSRAAATHGNNKTGRGALNDISENRQQHKKQQIRKKNATKAAFAVSCDDVADIQLDPMDLVNNTVDLVSTIEIETETEKPEWYSPDPQYVSDYMNDIMHCYRQSEVGAARAPVIRLSNWVCAGRDADFHSTDT